MKKILILLGCLIFLSPQKVSADLGLSVTPPVTEILLAPNKSLTLTFQLTNTSNQTLEVTPSFHQLLPQGDLGHSTIDPRPLNLSSIPLTLTQLSPDSPSLTLNSHATTSISYSLAAASLDTPTDVYLALLFTPHTSSPSSTATLLPAISSLILTTITPLPALSTDLRVASFDPPTLHDSSLPLSLKATLQNHAPTMLHVTGELNLKNSQGSILSTTTFDPTLILAETSRTLPQLTLTPSLLHIGPYTAELKITTESGRELLSVHKTIWFLPLRLFISLILVVLVLLLLYTRANRLTRHRNKD